MSATDQAGQDNEGVRRADLALRRRHHSSISTVDNRYFAYQNRTSISDPNGSDVMAACRQTGNGAGRLHYIRMDRSARDALSMLRSPGVDALVVIDGERPTDGAIIGIITEREIFRALASRGLEALDNLVWMLAREDFTSVDVSMSNTDRLKKFCAYRTDQIAVTDGFVLTSVQSIWNCIDDMSGTSRPAHS